jgi:predicted GIY-YIG superfamily endonuclease
MHNKLVNDLTIDYKNREADYALRVAEMSHNLDAVKDSRFSAINQAATKYREKLYNEIQQEIAGIMNSFSKKQSELEKIKTELLNDILELQSSRDALIEANKREEELRLQQEFYKIILKEQDFNDIKLLKSIEQYLYNKDALYKLIWTQFYMTPTKDTLNRIIGKEKTSGIYKITNQTNGKVYIGQSVDVHTRLTNHIKAAIGIGTIAHQLVHDAMAAHGIENFTFELVEKCDKNQLNRKEKLWIETYASDKYGYNRTAGGSKEEQ